MKKMILCAVLMVSIGGVANAQKQQTKASKRPSSTTKAISQNQQKPVGDNISASRTYTLSHTNNANAFSSNEIGNRYYIADSTIRVLNRRAATNAAGSPFTIRDITGVGKGAYGIFKGQLTLNPLGARSTGATTGAGSVGTGTSPGLIGTTGPAMGLNGKNPYAGSNVYGTLRPGISRNDSTTNRWVRE